MINDDKVLDTSRRAKKYRAALFGFIKEHTEVVFAGVIFTLFLLFVLMLDLFLKNKDGFLGNLLGEGHGFLADILIFGIVLVLYNKAQERKRDIKRWQEEIEDFRGWDEKEATFRIVGAVKRLNKAGITAIDLSECFLENAFLNNLNLQNSNLTRADLRNARFVRTNLGAAIFQGAKLQGAWLTYADLRNADLSRSRLEGAMFGAANLQGANLSHSDCQGAEFDDTELKGASLLKADLRNARYLEAKQLMSAKTLYRARLDREVEEEVRPACPQLFEDPRKR
jgi:hypothetical protein